jgi:hypothetical protein
MWAHRFIALAFAALFLVACGGKSVATVGGEAGSPSECDDALCGGECVNTMTDENNCGDCDVHCSDGARCVGGYCQGGDDCPPPLEMCNGECVDMSSSQDNCGGCGFYCGPDRYCAGGNCILSCPSGQCGNNCVDFGIDSTNCGFCGNVCGPGSHCSGGICVPACSGAICNGVCVDLLNDPSNCGGCGYLCIDPGFFCSQGFCQSTCPPDLVYCNGVCTDWRFDPQNCGGCGGLCPDGWSCENGECQSPCPTGTWCNGVCVDFSSDPRNCGGCGNNCGTSPCVNGICSAPSRCGNNVIDPGEEVDPPQSPLPNVPVNPRTCRYDFSQITQWYCNGTCGNWDASGSVPPGVGVQGCQQGDADAFCRLKLDNPAAVATSFGVTTAQQTGGVCCPPPTYPPGSLGCTNLGVLSSRGVNLSVSVHPSDLFSMHHQGNVIVGLTCAIPL